MTEHTIEISIRAEPIGDTTQDEVTNVISWIRGELAGEPEVISLEYGHSEPRGSTKAGEAVTLLSLIAQVAPAVIDRILLIIHQCITRVAAPNIEIIITDRRKSTQIRFNSSIPDDRIVRLAKKLRRGLE